MGDNKNEPQNIQNISVVIPVINEVSNIRKLINEIIKVSNSTDRMSIDEILFVDDGSSDGTVELIRKISGEQSSISVVVKERQVKKGTVNAQLFGLSSCKNNVVVVMDGDLQHPAKYIPDLVTMYLSGFDLVLGSRYVPGARTERKAFHGVISRVADLLARILLPWVRELKDPISGFMVINRDVLNSSVDLNGYNKLSLYILSSCKKLTVAEVPYVFTERINGKSKVTAGGFDFIEKYVGELLFYKNLRKLLMRPYKSGYISQGHSYLK